MTNTYHVNHALAIKADLALPWTKLRVLRRYGQQYCIMHNILNYIRHTATNNNTITIKVAKGTQHHCGK